MSIGQKLKERLICAVKNVILCHYNLIIVFGKKKKIENIYGYDSLVITVL